MKLLEGDSVELDRVHENRVERAARMPGAEDDERLGKDLQGVNDTDDEIEKDHWRKHGNRHVSDKTKRPGTIEFRGLVELPRYVLQTRQENDNDRAYAPHTKQDERRHRPGGTGQPRY